MRSGGNHEMGWECQGYEELMATVGTGCGEIKETAQGVEFGWGWKERQGKGWHLK